MTAPARFPLDAARVPVTAADVAKTPQARALLGKAAEVLTAQGKRIEPGDVVEVRIPGVKDALTSDGWRATLGDAPSPAVGPAPSALLEAVSAAEVSGHFTANLVYAGTNFSGPHAEVMLLFSNPAEWQRRFNRAHPAILESAILMSEKMQATTRAQRGETES